MELLEHCNLALLGRNDGRIELKLQQVTYELLQLHFDLRRLCRNLKVYSATTKIDKRYKF